MRRWYEEASHGCAGTSPRKHVAAEPCKYFALIEPPILSEAESGDSIHAPWPNWVVHPGHRNPQQFSHFRYAEKLGIGVHGDAFLLSLGLRVVDAIFG